MSEAAVPEAVHALRRAQESGQVVRVRRAFLEDDGAELTGIIVAHSETFALIKTIDDNLRLDGFAVVGVSDVTSVDLDFQRPFYDALALVSEWEPVVPPAIELDSMRAVLESVNTVFPLMGVHRELTDPYYFEVGRIQMITDESLVIARVDCWATALPISEAWRFDEITCVSFGSLYLQNLWSVAMSMASLDAKR